MLKAQGYKIKDRRADNMCEISKGEIINYFYIFGGKDERSQDLVQRNYCCRCVFRRSCLDATVICKSSTC